ncbi:uncharacterized protein LOC109802947 [Cajanus cajan]|uniref:Uncharacterized protein n=1 Tax=Cajanus cajan TaxID=3821 RepID=A0A151UAD2_CAJCA|nr:uncharacterized protein LOC109802947 [Cajanus cajan]KYP76229.1 hypothetical protein KK1_020462 [Cajanus cajan]
MLFSKQLLSFYKQPPPLLVPLSRHINEGIFKENRFIKTPYSSSCGIIVHAVKEDSQSQQYEVDPEKAREALKKLDDQIQSLSNKQASTSKLRASEVKFPKEEAIGNDKLEISDSFLATLAGGLILFTIFYNVLFYSVIKPAIDGP